jgi:hypothetical protein
MDQPEIPNAKLHICGLIVHIINETLKRKLQNTKIKNGKTRKIITWVTQGNNQKPLDCNSKQLVTCKHLFYALSGGYGFEGTLKKYKLLKLYEQNFGTDDLDFKIYFDEARFERAYGRTIDTKWYKEFRAEVLGKLKCREIVKQIQILNVSGLGIGFATEVVDMFVGRMTICESLKFFMKCVEIPTGGVMNLEYTSKYAIFSAIHMFMICHAIVVGGVVLCKNDNMRVPKFKKIMFRVLLLVDMEDLYLPMMNEAHFHTLSRLLWLTILNDQRFLYYRYARAILAMTKLPETFPEQTSGVSIPGQVGPLGYGGGPGDEGNDPIGSETPDACNPLDNSTMFELLCKEDINGMKAFEEGMSEEEIKIMTESAECPVEDSQQDAGESDETDINEFDNGYGTFDTPNVDGIPRGGGSADGTGKAATLLGCVGALVFATVVGSVRR